MIRKIMIFIFLCLVSSSAYCEHELLGLVDATTGEGIPDARNIFTLKSEITNTVRTEITNAVIADLTPSLRTNFMQINSGATVSTNSRTQGQSLIFSGTDTNGNYLYTHSWAQASATNVYSFFFKDNGTNVWRLTDGSTEKFDVRFSTNSLPSNSIPVFSIENYQTQMITSGVDVVHSQTNTINFGMTFLTPPVGHALIKGDPGQLMSVYCTTYEDHLIYVIRNSAGIVTNDIEIYWSACGIPE